MKITEILLNMLLKKGLGGELKNFKTTIEIPNQDSTNPPIKCTITADQIQIKVEKE